MLLRRFSMNLPAQPTKILRIIARLNAGGPAIHTILLTQGLNGDRFTSRLVTGVVNSTEGDMEYYAEQMKVVPVVIPELGRDPAVGKDLKAFFRLYRLMRAEWPDVIHTHTTKAGILGRLAGLLYNFIARITGRSPAKLVHTFHGHIFHEYFSPFWSRLLVVAEMLLARVTHRIIAVSELVKRDLVERYRICPAGKVTVVSLGLDFSWVNALDDHSGSLRAEYGVSSDAIVIGIVGRLTLIKNHGLLLSSLRLVRRDDVKVFVLGDGELRTKLERSVRDLGLEGSVIFTGWQRDPARIYTDLNIVCLTSRNEGTPVALIETMAAGRPFVATRVGGVPDLMVGEGTKHAEGFEVFANGVLVPPDDPPALASALRYLAERPDLRRAMGSVGQAAVLKRFSKDRMLQEIESIYAELLGPAHGGA